MLETSNYILQTTKDGYQSYKQQKSPTIGSQSATNELQALPVNRWHTADKCYQHHTYIHGIQFYPTIMRCDDGTLRSMLCLPVLVAASPTVEQDDITWTSARQATLGEWG